MVEFKNSLLYLFMPILIIIVVGLIGIAFIVGYNNIPTDKDIIDNSLSNEYSIEVKICTECFKYCVENGKGYEGKDILEKRNNCLNEQCPINSNLCGVSSK